MRPVNGVTSLQSKAKKSKVRKRKNTEPEDKTSNFDASPGVLTPSNALLESRQSKAQENTR